MIIYLDRILLPVQMEVSDDGLKWWILGHEFLEKTFASPASQRNGILKSEKLFQSCFAGSSKIVHPSYEYNDKLPQSSRENIQRVGFISHHRHNSYENNWDVEGHRNIMKHCKITWNHF
jgi:hypothetical protein